LLYARKVILVEGPAEMFLIPALVKKVMNIDLDDLGISIIPIYGVHFHVYAKMFGENTLPKKCVIIADGDQQSSDACQVEGDDDYDEVPDLPQLESLKSRYVNVFYCDTTFEKALTIPGLLQVLEKTARECPASKIGDAIASVNKLFSEKEIKEKEARLLLEPLSERVLKTAKRFGKARFSQIASKYTDFAENIPEYIAEAIKWLVE
jgi:putative ATP-dependent endonuclease of the OLD family